MVLYLAAVQPLLDIVQLISTAAQLIQPSIQLPATANALRRTLVFTNHCHRKANSVSVLVLQTEYNIQTQRSPTSPTVTVQELYKNK